MKNPEKHPLAAQRRKHLKEAAALPMGKRITYYLYYFKAWLIGVPIAVLAIVFFAKSFFCGADTALYGYFVNATQGMNVEDDVFLEDYLTYAQIEEEKETVYFNSTFSLKNADQMTLSKLLSNLTLGEIDFFVCEEEAFDEFAREGLLSDLEVFLTEEELSFYQDRLIRFEVQNTNPSDETPILNGCFTGIDITDSVRLQESGAYSGEAHIYFCIAVNAPHKERTLAFLDWLLAE